MGLLVPDPPRDSIVALRESLGALAERGSFSASGLREARSDQISATVPHQVFTLGLADARSGDVAKAARPTGWRYLLAVDEQVVASAETTFERGERHTFSHVNAGPFVGGTVEALLVAEHAARDDERGLELRLLNVPALYLMSVWLVRSDDGSSVFVPIAPAPSGFEPNRLYREDEFASRLRALAEGVPDLEPRDTRGGV
jgi:hypothetical protein